MESNKEQSLCYLDFAGGSGTVVPVGDGTVNLSMSHVPLVAALALIRELRKGDVS